MNKRILPVQQITASFSCMLFLLVTAKRSKDLQFTPAHHLASGYLGKRSTSNNTSHLPVNLRFFPFITLKQTIVAIKVFRNKLADLTSMKTCL